MLKVREQKSSDDSGKKYIIDNLIQIKAQLDVCNQKFQMETDEYLIDSIIFEIQSLNKRYQYFLKAAKKNGYTAL